MNEYTITLTSKGQVTLPVAVRRSLGVAQSGGTLRLHYDEKSGQATIQRPVSFASLQAKASSYADPDVKPLDDPRGYYQQREVKL